MQKIQEKVKRNMIGNTPIQWSRKYILSSRVLSKTLTQAAGLLRGKLKRTPLAYQKRLRKEW